LNILDAILLGILQGITEFLPVSSSGHLVILEAILKVQKTPSILFEASLHLGTLIAIIILFWKKIDEIIKFIFGGFNQQLKIKSDKNLFLRYYQDDPIARLLILIIISNIATVIIGLGFEDIFRKMFGSVKWVGVMLLITGCILLLTKMAKSDSITLENLRVEHALIIGIAQGIAVAPGISRSGATIATALLIGIARPDAAIFSFLISIPAIIGAEFREILLQGVELSYGWLPILSGLLISFITGFIALKFLINIVNRGKLYYFAFYCWIVGIGAIIL
jgi:undecaprenyl-diphosphatase